MKGFWEKTENTTLFLWLLLIPTQLGKHFWPEWSHVIGVRSDYLGPILYLNDLVWIVWAGSKFLGSFKTLEPLKKKGRFSFENLLVVGFVFLNILVAGNRWVAVYRWVRIMQGAITIKNLKSETYRVKTYLGWIIPCWVGLESFLGLAQIVKGGSLQGIWYWLGERRFTLTTVGVAQMSVLGEGLIRAYGTFSHPNSLAGFLLVAFLWWKQLKKKRDLGYWTVVWLSILGIIISGSRIVWGLLVVQFLIFNWKFLKQDRKKIWGYGIMGAGVAMLILALVGMNYRTSDFVGGWDNDSLSKRISLNMAAIKMWKENYMLGVGAGNFVAKLPEYQTGAKFYWLQPVHNIFLLAGTEIGMLGIILAVKLLIFNVKIFPTPHRRGDSPLTRRIGYINSRWVIWGVVIVTGMMDHYWLTLPQNWNLLMVMLGVI